MISGNSQKQFCLPLAILVSGFSVYGCSRLNGFVAIIGLEFLHVLLSIEQFWCGFLVKDICFSDRFRFIWVIDFDR